MIITGFCGIWAAYVDLHRRFGLWRCRVLGWHKPTYTGFDGMSAEAKCRRCGYEGLIDSQGNLF